MLSLLVSTLLLDYDVCGRAQLWYVFGLDAFGLLTVLGGSCSCCELWDCVAVCFVHR